VPGVTPHVGPRVLPLVPTTNCLSGIPAPAATLRQQPHWFCSS
jgi:hypothetical protein